MRNGIAIVLTARASYAKFETILEALGDTNVTLYACGGALLAKYGGVVDVVRSRFPRLPVVEVWSQYEGTPPIVAAKSAAALTSELAALFDLHQPSVVVVMADRYEVLAAAQAAAYLNIPVAHIQGGERTGSIDDRCRDAISHLSTYHFTATQMAGLRVCSLVGGPEGVQVTGCPSIDIAARAKDDPPVTAAELSGAGPFVDPEQPFLFCLQHADVTEWDLSYLQMQETLAALVNVNLPVLLQWPNQDPGGEGISKAIRVFRDKNRGYALHTMPNLPPRRFLRLMTQAKVVVGNSSAGIRECSFLGTPVVNIGLRQIGREQGPNVIDTGYDREAIYQAILRQLDHGPYPSSGLYGTGRAGEQVAQALKGYSQSGGRR